MIHFIQTGGTIDKDYLPTETSHGYNFIISAPAFEGILNQLHLDFSYTADLLLQKDSLDLTAEDRVVIRKAVMAADSDRVVVTHGTDTMTETAHALAGISGKTIVLTGAMKPYRFTNSDAEYNLGMAIGVAQVAPPGVYMVLHGVVTQIQT